MSAQRTRIVAGNWKMNLTPAEALEYFPALTKELRGAPKQGVRRVIFPVAYALGSETQRAAATAQVELGAQNVHWEEKGAFTGELSAPALKSMGISWVLIAHSERRQYFAETDETAAKRFALAAKHRMNVIYCVGEKLQERESGQMEAVLKRQVSAFMDVLKTEVQKPESPWNKGAVWSIAYEPVWAIGTGKTATTEQAEEAHRFIRKLVWDSLGLPVAQKLPILYGGSVTAENAHALMSQPNVDGVLVGGASLKPQGFARILESC